MSNISLEQIDLIMQRANVSYSEAKEALEQCNENTVEALLFLEKANKIKASTTTNKHNANCEGFKSFIKKLHATNFKLSKNGRTYLDLPLSITLIGALICCPFSILALVLVFACGMKMDISGNTDIAEKINATIMDFKK